VGRLEAAVRETETPLVGQASALVLRLPGGAPTELAGLGTDGFGRGAAPCPGKVVLNFSGSLRVFVAMEPCDMRKGSNGLHALAAQRLGEDPSQGAFFVFTNRRTAAVSSGSIPCSAARRLM